MTPYRARTALLCIALTCSLLVITYSLNSWHHDRLNTERMRLAVTDISEQIGGIRALMASLVGLHQSAPAPQHSSLLLYSNQILEHADYITSIGRYEHVSQAERRSFEAHMSESGLLDYRIKGIDEHGNVSSLPAVEWSYPISVLEPLLPTNARLIGTNLGSLDGLEQMLDNIARTNGTLVTSFPESWPFGGHLVQFRPVYRGQQTPGTDATRWQQSAGGFWMSIDVTRLLSGLAARLSDFDIKVRVEHGDTVTALYSQEPRYNENLYLRFLYPSQQLTEVWTSDSGRLSIRFEKEVGFTGTALLVAASCMVAFLLLLLQFLSHQSTKRQSEQEQNRSREALYDAREMAERTLNAMQDAILTLDTDLRISHINPAAVILFKARPDDTLGRHFSEVIEFRLLEEPDTLLDLPTALQHLSHGSKGEFDVIPIANLHSDLILKLTLTSLHNQENTITGHVLVMRNVSHERRLTRKLAYQANHDSLTGCYNRHHFEQALAGLLDEMAFSDNQHALFYLDLDQFKTINDTCGHRAGDRLLKELTTRLSSIVREQDTLSRLGGDEFALLLTNVTAEHTQAISERLYKLFQGFIFHHEDKAFAVRASIGVVHLDQNCNNLNDVMTAADIACYAAKDAGRNNLLVYSADNHALAQRSEELSWLPRLQNALQNDEFLLYMQPIARLSKNEGETAGVPPESIEHFEFLLRLRDSEGMEFTPWQFIRAAERYDLMRQIDRWVIRTALRTIAELDGGPAGHCSYSINLSGQSVADPTLADYIREQFDQYKPNPEKVWFELTETAAIANFSVAVDLFHSIRDNGSLIALDDFGSGLSSFAYLKNMPIDIIKIDGQFVQDIASNRFDRHMVLAIHQLSTTMAVKTVAEYVENQEILDELTDIGIDYAQGYHIGKPASVEDTLVQCFSSRRVA
ncbi:bifunctional diguanylate cyclase/phosphodiesterase [Granulosicoccus sp. 3-233]